jgi:hypothetical protein
MTKLNEHPIIYLWSYIYIYIKERREEETEGTQWIVDMSGLDDGKFMAVGLESCTTSFNITQK